MLLSLLPDGFWSQLGILFVTLLAAVYFYSRNCLNYWKYRGIPYIAGSFPFGCIGDVVLQRRSVTELFLDFYDQMKGHKYIGIYSFLQPQLIVKDLDIIKNIFVKDFSNFTDRGIYSDEKVDPLMGNLFFMEGQPWKKLRAKLSPTFTSGKMKIMYETMKEKSLELQKYCLNASSETGTIDAKDITVRYGLDVISSTALGLEGNNFNEYNTDMRKITQEFTAPSTIQLIRTTVSMVCRDLAKLIQLRLTSKKVENYFFELVKKTVEYRKTNNVKRNDFMQLLIELNNNNEEETTDDKTTTGNNVSLTLNEMAAQSFVFVVAGYETTSVTLGFCLYELAMNPQIQEKLISEIDEAGEDIQYDELQKLPYMHMVVNETLRKHPPVTALQRECANDYTLPDGTVILAGTQIMIPMLGIHRDPELFPNPLEFNPERFSKENSDNIKPYSFMPFGEGPRICIGYRFAYMQVKTGLHSLLSRFRIELCEKTPIDLKLEKKTFVYNVEGGMWLRLKDRKA